MSSASPSVTVVVLSWNGGRTTLDCLASVEQLDYPDYSVVVVDNGSTDNTLAQVSSRFPEVERIMHNQNMGLSEGFNSGLRWSLAQGHDYTLLLNNDVLLAPDALLTLVDEAERCPEAGMLSPKIYLGEPPSDRFYWTGGWLTLNPFGAPTRGYRRRDRGQYDEVCEAQLAANTAVLVRTKAVRNVGLFDPAYFYMCEDFDWSLRARQNGHRILYVPGARVWHLQCATIGFLSRRMVYYYLRNMLLLARRYHPHPRLMQAMLTFQVLPFNAAFILTGRSGGLRSCLWALIDYRRGRFGETTRDL
jgi:GT2 family glycosyltransferase